MKYFAKTIGAALLLTVIVAGTALAASPPGKNRIICGPDETTAVPSGSQGCVFDVGAGEYAYAYYGTAGPESDPTKFFPNGWDKPLDEIGQLSFRYAGTDPDGVLRWSIQIDEDGSGTTNDPNTNPYVFVGADACNDGAGLVDVLNDPTCTVYYGANSYANWAAFTTAFPNATLYFAFVIADGPWSGTVSSIKIGKPGK